MKRLNILIKGAGEVASAVAHKLHRSHFNLCMTEIDKPLAISRGVSFCETVYDGTIEVAGVRGRLIDSYEDIQRAWDNEEIPVIIDPQAKVKEFLKPDVVIDAIMAKRNTGTAITDAPLVIGLGPGFCAGKDVHTVIETNNSENLGKVITEGESEPNTGIPLEVGQLTKDRAMFAPVEGIFKAAFAMGDMIQKGDAVGHVDEVGVEAQTSGVFRAVIRDGVHIAKGTKLGEIDPRGEEWLCYAIRPRMRTIAGGVLEAVLMHFNQNQ